MATKLKTLTYDKVPGTFTVYIDKKTGVFTADFEFEKGKRTGEVPSIKPAKTLDAIEKACYEASEKLRLQYIPREKHLLVYFAHTSTPVIKEAGRTADGSSSSHFIGFKAERGLGLALGYIVLQRYTLGDDENTSKYAKLEASHQMSRRGYVNDIEIEEAGKTTALADLDSYFSKHTDHGQIIPYSEEAHRAMIQATMGTAKIIEAVYSVLRPGKDLAERLEIASANSTLQLNIGNS